VLNLNPLNKYIQEQMESHKTPGLALAVTDRRETLHLGTFGYSDLGTRTPIAPTDLFEIGSIGKTFTAIAVLQAVERGELDLHSPVAEYLPWFRVKTSYNPITIHHLLSHTSGLIEGTDFSPDGRGEVWALRETETGFPPGERFHYSNVGYKVLGLALEAAAGRSYPEILRTGILEPIKMDDSLPQITHPARLRMAKGYQPLYDDRPTHPSQPLYPAPWLETDTSDGSVASTAVDMAKFVRMLLNAGMADGKRILSKSSFDLMTTHHISQDEDWYYGYGLEIFEREGYAHIGHGGDMPGYEAYISLDQDNDLGCILLFTKPYPTGISLPILDFLRAARLGINLPDLPSPTDPCTLIEADLLAYAGVYKKAAADIGGIEAPLNDARSTPEEIPENLVFKASGGSLALEIAGTLIPLEPRGNDKFYTSHPDYDRFLFHFGFTHNIAADKQAVEVFWGPCWFVSDSYLGPGSFDTPSSWRAFCGHYRSHNPWDSNFRIFKRKGNLILAWPSGEEQGLNQLDENSFRIGDRWSPERIIFDQILDGRALRARRSGCDYYRFFTP
jgi:CubicO group peptidase (beta-lactamase class C family)